jgi:LiaI-LiaF-like transmembrane region
VQLAAGGAKLNLRLRAACRLLAANSFVQSAICLQAPKIGGAPMLTRSRTCAIVLIIVGTLFLLSNLGIIPEIRPLLRQWWPLILVIVGVLMLIQRS